MMATIKIYSMADKHYGEKQSREAVIIGSVRLRVVKGGVRL